MIEVWRDIPKFPNYKVSNLGRIWNTTNGRILKPHKCGFDNLYLGVKLYRYGKRYAMKVHRLVAFAFLLKPNDYRYNEVNHLDCDTENNCVDNLEWTTRELNEAHKKFWEAGQQLDLEIEEA